jgi:LmbE family N-acetylglucosaminyl deacetylase
MNSLRKSKIARNIIYMIRYLTVALHDHYLRSIHCRPMTNSHKSVMVFAPHQDDETLGCGGLLALKNDQGLAAAVVFVTDGQGSHPHHPHITRDRLKSMRKQEAIAALRVLGVAQEKIHFLDLVDGKLADLSPEEFDLAVQRITHLLLDFRPEEVCVTYRQDRNTDHQATYALVQAAIAASQLDIELLQYPIWSRWQPWTFDFNLPELQQAYRLPIRRVLERKRRALQEYRSQCLPLPPDAESSLPPYFLNLFLTPSEIFFKRPAGQD